ncbi:Hypothetical_protein [Hexamita inflata]|uniref:Hypothetical_protein n=1 Tax=Hexamita inflata TaxID=28002 RepID=A0AA86PT79_9EUKA|nr:Hypothetical protein HINF_LOCUS30788 [Hexamita inflata]
MYSNSDECIKPAFQERTSIKLFTPTLIPFHTTKSNPTSIHILESEEPGDSRSALRTHTNPLSTTLNHTLEQRSWKCGLYTFIIQTTHISLLLHFVHQSATQSATLKATQKATSKFFF